MNKNQKIYCNVCSCAFNDEKDQICELDHIKVCACPGCNNGKAQDESMCDSYKKRQHN